MLTIIYQADMQPTKGLYHTITDVVESGELLKILSLWNERCKWFLNDTLQFLTQLLWLQRMFGQSFHNGNLPIRVLSYDMLHHFQNTHFDFKDEVIDEVNFNNFKMVLFTMIEKRK